MTVSSHVAHATNPNAIKFAHTKIIELAKQNNFGNKTPFRLDLGIKEYAEEFLREEKCFGMYVFNGVPVYFINEPILSSTQKDLIEPARLRSSGTVGISYLKEGEKVINISKTSFTDIVEQMAD